MYRNYTNFKWKKQHIEIALEKQKSFLAQNVERETSFSGWDGKIVV